MNFPKEAKKNFIFILVLLMISLVGWPLEFVGHIQIKCEPGAQIFLDGNNMGSTRSDVGGLILQDVPSGKHTLKAGKEGYQSLEADIDLAGEQVLIYEFKSFIPTFETYEEGEESESTTVVKTGKIIIQTLPVECSISIPSLSVESLQKTKDKRIFDKVPAGIYEIELVSLEKKVKYNLHVKEDDTVRLMVNFINEKITEESLSDKTDQPAPRADDAATIASPSASPPQQRLDNGWSPSSEIPAPVVSPIAQTQEASQDQVLFTDAFPGQDKTRPEKWLILKADSPDFWYLQAGELATGNGDNLKGGDGYSYAIITAPGSNAWTDYSIESSCWIRQANGRVLLAARWQDENNHYEGVFETFQGDCVLKIEKVMNGKREALKIMEKGSDGSPLPALENTPSSAQSAHLRFTVSGSMLTLTLEDKFTIGAEDGSFSSGTAGLGEWYHYIHFDNVVVKKAPGR